MDGFVQVAIDPHAGTVHLGLLRGKRPKASEAVERNESLREAVLREGPATLRHSDKARLLRDAESMALLHRQVWRIRDPNLAN